MYRARDAVEYAAWLSDIDDAATALDVDDGARGTARDLFLSAMPAEDRSKPAIAAASLYAGTLVAGDERSQAAVAEAMDVSRLSVQSRWKDLLADAGLSPPSW
ncbi:MAG: transcription initiation factor IIB family protein [Halobacteriaceae archaeon]